jgi:RND family efflux transporter MFP subunit
MPAHHLLPHHILEHPFMSTKPSSSSSRPALVAIVAILIAGGVVAGGLVTRHNQGEQLKESAAERAVPTVTLVSMKDVPAGDLELPARIEAWARAPIYARVSGYLSRWNVDIGTPVKAGQVLAQIDTPDLDQDLAQAQAQLAVARTGLTLADSTAGRWRSLVSQNAVSKQEADEKQNDFVSRQASVQALQASVSRQQALKRYTTLVAPFDGVVTARNIDVGALVSVGGAAGSELFVVSDIRKLRVYVQVPQRQVALIKPGSKAELTVPERPGSSYSATVESAAQAIAAGSGTMLVQLVVDNKGGELLPGAYANLRFDLPLDAETVMVPPGALMMGKDGVRVATLDAANKVRIKKVSIGRDLGTAVQLAGGVGRADRIIESPPDGIAEGDVVRVAQAVPVKAKS